MAGPLQNMLYRRPVRNAIRALLGMQPRYGNSGMGQQRSRMRGSPTGTGQTTGQTTATAIGPLPPFPPLSEGISSSMATTPAATDPVKAAAALAAPAPDAMAQAIGFARPDEEQEAPSPSDAPAFKTPSLDRYLAAAANASPDVSQPTGVQTARSGLFANLPAMTPTPATTAMGIATDPRADEIRQERDAVLARAVAKRKAAEGLQAAPTAQAVSQPAAQQNPEPSSATPPADPFAARRALAQQYRDRAGLLEANIGKMMQQFYMETDINKKSQLQGMIERENFRAAQQLQDARAIENAMDADRRMEAQTKAAKELKGMEKDPPDTLQSNMAELASAVRANGVEAAAQGHAARFQFEGKATDPASIDAAKNFARQFGYGVQLGDYVTQGGKLAQLTTDSPLISGIASLPDAADDKKRRQLIASIVGSTQNILRSNGGDGGMSNPQATAKLIQALDAMVKQAVDANKPKGYFW